MEKVAVIIPIYKKSKYIKENIELLTKQYDNIEIILALDLPDKDFLEEVKKIKNNKVKVIISYERRGKVKNVNEVVKQTDAKYLIFFDANVRIIKINVKRIIDLLKKYEIVDFVKIIKPNGFITKMMHIEFFTYYILAKVQSSILRSLTLNGAGFATRKDIWEKVGGYSSVIVEDVDYAMKVYLNGGKYYLDKETIIEKEYPPSFKRWYDQRKRWISGGIEFFINYYKEIINYFIKYPKFPLVILFLVMPSIFILFILSLFPHNILINLSLAILIIFSAKISPLLFFIVPLTFLISLLKGLLFALLYGTLILLIYKYLGRNSPFTLKSLWILGYIYIYSFMYLFLILGVLFYFFVFERFPGFDWKI